MQHEIQNITTRFVSKISQQPMDNRTPLPVRSISRTVCTRRWSDLMLSMAGISHVSFERDKVLPDDRHEDLRYFIHLDPGHDYERMLIRRIHAMQPNARIIGWICANTLSPDIVLQLLEAGIHGIVSDDAAYRETSSALNVEGNDRLHPNSFLSQALIHEWKKNRIQTEALHINSREEQAIRLRAAGRTAREIGDALCVSKRTVDQWFWRLYQRSGCNNFRQLEMILKSDDPSGSYYAPGNTDPRPGTKSLK